jgi:uncharacterized RDD family membrane protein YckC
MPPAGMPPAAGAPFGAPLGMADGAPGPRASWGERAIAYLIDVGVAIALYIVLTIISVVFGAVSDALGALVSLVAFLVYIGYFLYLGYLNGVKGQSPGKALTGLKVVSAENGQVIGAGMGIVRYVVFWAIGAFTCGIGGLINVLFPLWDDKQQTIHDKAVKTVVLKDQAKLPFGPDLFKP